jgi:3-methyladenine DNA glycosylase/8-oxoguanine DNA glycosylase
MKQLNTTLKISARPPFDFKQTATTHGWVGLAPNYWNRENNQIERIQQLSNGLVVRLLISGNLSETKPEVNIVVNHSAKLSASDEKEIRKIVEHMLRLDEDFSDLYLIAEKKKEHFTGMLRGFGRLLRSPSVFEDIVKTICTTNIQWAGTKRMVQELVSSFGKPFDLMPEQKTFPSALDIAGNSADIFAKKTNLGYRTDYIYLLAVQVAKGDIDTESFLDQQILTNDLRRILLKIKGIGNYSAATMLMLLGHYDELPVDSVFREFVFKKYFKGKTVNEKKAGKIYKDWDRWKYLAYWYDMTNEE